MYCLSCDKVVSTADDCCPDCGLELCDVSYGDEAFCARCGETLSSDSGDDWLCSECARDEADE